MEMENNQSFNLGKRTEELILATGLNPYAFCKMKGISHSLITKWINNNPDPKFSTVIRVCRALDISVGKFVEPEEGLKDSTRTYALLFWWRNLTEEQQVVMLNAIAGVAERRKV